MLHLEIIWGTPINFAFLSRLLCPWDSPGKNTGVGCHALLPGTFPTQRSNLGSPALQADPLPPEPPGKPVFLIHAHMMLVRVTEMTEAGDNFFLAP